VTLGLLGALVAALAYGAATVIQAIGVRRAGALPAGTPLTGRVRAAWPYAVGLGLDAAGFLASVAALRTLPLFLVESAVASSVAVTAVLSVLVLRVRLGAAEVVALCGVGAGLTGLALAAVDGPAVSPGTGAAWWLAGAAALVAALLGVGALDRDRRRGAVLLSVAAGLGFGGVGVAARLLEVPSPWWRLTTSGLAWALVVHAALATVAYAAALGRGRVTTVAALTFATETVVPAAVGLMVLGDRVAPGRMPLAAAAFAVTLAGCITLAGRAEPTDAATSDPASDPASAPGGVSDGAAVPSRSRSAPP
jgi:hypothetical protein